MRPLSTALRLTIFVLTLTTLANPSAAQSPDHWIGTWGAAPIAKVNKNNDFSQDTTLRQTVHISLGGTPVRVTFTNELGTEPLTIGGANIAVAAAPGVINPKAAYPLTFNGHSAFTIPPGAVAVSDDVALNIPALSNLTITLFLPAQNISTITTHDLALQTNYFAPGNQLYASSLPDAHTNDSWRFLKNVEIESPVGASIVTFGDSITDGWRSTKDANNRWPDVLAQRLQDNRSTRDLAVLNEGIGGNRVLHDEFGPNALSRFDRDVIDQAGVEFLIILEGINDIGHAQDPVHPRDAITADELITGLSQLARRAHTHGIKVFGATLTPYMGAGYSSPAGETIRQAVNQWIRTTPDLDGVIDFDHVTRDPSNPSVFASAFDSGDHLHPGVAGYQSMGEAINLKLFTSKP
ncbi:MAG: SGNH/GDSL hydrolase family protein [Acidobacteria bacterium]|nr:SGNH/GDSL hydrolase family protein [Acidobacteriota bacterium]